MNGVWREPMTSPYSSFSITITAMCAGGPPASAAVGDMVVWTATWRVALMPHAVRSAAASTTTTLGSNGRGRSAATRQAGRASAGGGTPGKDDAAEGSIQVTTH